MDCPFCLLVKNGLPSHTIYENESFFIMLDRESLGFGHCMLIPKRHDSKIYELEEEEYNKLLSIARAYAQKLQKALSVKSVAYASFGSRIGHAHLHLVPYNDEDVLQNPGEHVRNLTEEQLNNEANELRMMLSNVKQ